MGEADKHRSWPKITKLFGFGGQTLALLAAAFMCLASFHDAAHDHADEDLDKTQLCLAFHLVSQTPAATPSDIPEGPRPSDLFSERLQPSAAFTSRIATHHQILPRGPPLQSIAA